MPHNLSLSRLDLVGTVSDSAPALVSETPALVSEKYGAARIKALFDDVFKADYQTVLLAGDDEPLYVPADEEQPYHRVIFANQFFSSALHEVAHWCIAGAQRRTEVDYGYWYQPGYRDDQAQRRFQQVEAKPQALEWIFSVAAGSAFRLSTDNLDCQDVHLQMERYEDFRQAVYKQWQQYWQNGLPHRARRFTDALLAFYRPGHRLCSDEFLLEALR